MGAIKTTLVSDQVPTTLLRIVFPITVLPKDDCTDFTEEVPRGLPCWTMMLAILRRGKRIETSGWILIWEF